MPLRHPPRLWLMTDERMGDALWPALARLPRGGGVVFRYYRTPPAERRLLFERVRRVARARRLVLVLAGRAAEAAAWRADGVHGRDCRRSRRPLLRTMPVHGVHEAVAARSADLAFISPVHPTRSHPQARALGVRGFASLARLAPRPVALGGMDTRRFAAIRRVGGYGWAAIDAWTFQKRKAVPR